MPIEWAAIGEVIITMDFDFWVDGQPIGYQVAGGGMDFWGDGQPRDIERTD